MRAHDHEVDGGRSQRPNADRIGSDDADLMYRAAAGWTDVLGSVGLLGLQRVVGNAGVEPLVFDEERSLVLDVVGSGGGSLLDADTHAGWSCGLDTTSAMCGCIPTPERMTRRTAVNAHGYLVGSNVVFQRDKYDLLDRG